MLKGNFLIVELKNEDMGLNRLLKKLAPDETLEEALYKKLTEKKLSENLYKTGELSEEKELSNKKE